MPFDNLFPQWGSSGEPPETGKEFQPREQYDSRHANYLWNGTRVMFDRVKSALGDHSARHEHGGDDEIDAGNLSGSSGDQLEMLYTNGTNTYWHDDPSPEKRLRSGTWRDDRVNWPTQIITLNEGNFSAYKIYLFGLGFGEDTDLYMDINDYSQETNRNENYQVVHQTGATQTMDTYQRIPIVTHVGAQIHIELTINAFSQIGQVSADVTGKPEHQKLINAVGLSDPYLGIPENVRFYVVNRSGETNWLNYAVYGIKDRREWGHELYHPNGILDAEPETSTESTNTDAMLNPTESVEHTALDASYTSSDDRDHPRRSRRKN